jgi:glycosyltransferase involved in cell wall biosynthesis
MLGEQVPPAVTVVIPVWDDYVEFLPDAVDSVRRDAPGVPIVVVDNASQVPVPRLAGTAVVEASGRLSIGGVRNLGLAQVETEYVVMLDADDKVLPGTLEFLWERLEADPSLAVCASSIVEGDTGKRHRTPRRFVPHLSRWRRTFAFAHCVWSLYPIQGCSMLRTAPARESGGYADANWGDDWVLAVSLAFRGRIQVSERLSLYYRHTPDSVWRRGHPARELVASAGLVRARLRSDSAVPSWARALLPLIHVLQLFAVFALRPVYLAARGVRQLGSGTP